LNVSRERVVGYEVVHRDQGGGWFVGAGPRDGTVSGRIGVVIGSWARWSDFDDVGDGWQVGEAGGRPRGMPRPQGWVFMEGRISVVVPAPWVMGRYRERDRSSRRIQGLVRIRGRGPMRGSLGVVRVGVDGLVGSDVGVAEEVPKGNDDVTEGGDVVNGPEAVLRPLGVVRRQVPLSVSALGVDPGGVCLLHERVPILGRADDLLVVFAEVEILFVVEEKVISQAGSGPTLSFGEPLYAGAHWVGAGAPLLPSVDVTGRERVAVCGIETHFDHLETADVTGIEHDLGVTDGTDFDTSASGGLRHGRRGYIV